MQPVLFALQAVIVNKSPCCFFFSSPRPTIVSPIARPVTSVLKMSSLLPSATDDQPQIRQKKQTLRKEIRAKIRQVSEEEIKKMSEMVWQRLFQLPQYKSAKSIGLFLSMPKGEINTDIALRHAIKNGKAVFVPQVGKNFEYADMELLKVAIKDPSSDDIFHKDWPRNKWGIPEPPADMPIVMAKPGDIDLLVVPGLGFDKKGNRLGQGKGYYDRFIARMTENDIPLPLFAVGLTPQLVDGEIPVAEYDRQMDLVLMPTETIVPQEA